MRGPVCHSKIGEDPARVRCSLAMVSELTYQTLQAALQAFAVARSQGYSDQAFSDPDVFSAR